MSHFSPPARRLTDRSERRRPRATATRKSFHARLLIFAAASAEAAMTTSETAEASLDLYHLRELPSPSEFRVIEMQIGRVTKMMETRVVVTGALFTVDPQSYADTLARLADEPPA
jgi:hypothetical protein